MRLRWPEMGARARLRKQAKREARLVPHVVAQAAELRPLTAGERIPPQSAHSA